MIREGLPGIPQTQSGQKASILIHSFNHLLICSCKKFNWAPTVHLDHKEGWVLKNWGFWIVLEKTLESPLDSKDIKPVNPKENHPWIFTRKTEAEAEAPVVWPPDVKNQLIGKDPEAGKDWRQKEKGVTGNEMVGWHHQLKRQEPEKTMGDSEGQKILACCSSWGCKELDRTQQLNNIKCVSVQFSCSVMSDSLRPHGLQHARLPCPLPTPGHYSNSCPALLVMPSNHLILCCPPLLPPSIFPSIRVFSNELVLHIRWPKYWSFSVSISPSNEYSGLISFRIDWFDLASLWTSPKFLELIWLNQSE